MPTTILAQQHYNTFVQRMKDFPVRIDLMSRFRTPSEQKKNGGGSAERAGGYCHQDAPHPFFGYPVQGSGASDHRRGTAFRGDPQGKIKKIKDNVDVLTLTATPIPRTLHMSLVGIRDMSVLEEPPNDRLPIQTFVCEYNEEMVREAIVRELTRGGQVYYVYNRVNNIADVAAALQQLVPEAVVALPTGR